MPTIDPSQPLGVRPIVPPPPPPPPPPAPEPTPVPATLDADALAIEARVAASTALDGFEAGDESGEALQDALLAAMAPDPRQVRAEAEVETAELRSAVDWQAGQPGLSGTAANLRVTGGYERLGDQFGQWVGNNPAAQPPLANWLDFGKFASAEAGAQIAMLEKLESALALMPADPSIADVQQAYESLGPQGLALFKELATQFAEQQGVLGGVVAILSPAAKAAEFLAFATQRMGELRDTLVKGNTGIYGDVAPAFKVFLAAEQAGRDGVEALREAGFEQPPNDFVIQAFQAYKGAKAAEEQLAALPPGDPRRDALDRERQELMFRGNLLVGFKEQFDVLEQDGIFENNPGVQRLVVAMGGTMQLHLPDGQAYRLLPGGGDWTDFTTRMGLTELPAAPEPPRPDVVTVRTPQGREVVYQLPTLGSDIPPGTIGHLFQQHASGDRASWLHRNAAPRRDETPLVPPGVVVPVVGL